MVIKPVYKFAHHNIHTHTLYRRTNIVNCVALLVCLPLYMPKKKKKYFLFCLLLLKKTIRVKPTKAQLGRQAIRQTVISTRMNVSIYGTSHSLHHLFYDESKYCCSYCCCLCSILENTKTTINSKCFVIKNRKKKTFFSHILNTLAWPLTLCLLNAKINRDSVARGKG